MNLVSDKWIPVVMAAGTLDKMSLLELYAHAEDILDLACTPPQRIALMRLLICITQAALDGPEDEEDWLVCRNRLSKLSSKYLQRWQTVFDLRGSNPFMQIPGLEVDEGGSKPLDMLDCSLASGNNFVLFDHEASQDGRDIPDEDTSLNLLTFLNFSTQGKVGQAIWDGVKYSDEIFPAPCIGYVHTFVRASNLLDTIFFNLMTKRGNTTGILRLPNGKWGKPVWEQFPSDVKDEASFQNAAETYLGRLVPLSRFINLKGTSETQCIIGPTHKGYRINHLPAFREPWATVVQNRDGDERYLILSPEKHMWRELGSLLSLSKGEQHGMVGALSLANLVSFYTDFQEKTVDIWVGGLKAGAGGGKIIDMLEWVFSFPIVQFQETCMAKYLSGVQLAENGERVFKTALFSYFREMKVESISYKRGKARYWSILDRQYPLLLKASNDEKVYLGDTWYPIVRRAIEQAYAYVCPHQTPRQIQAFARGRTILQRLKKPEE
jgi:CRISPR system Cascade subunit CasA